jgi:hypothetical protein
MLSQIVELKYYIMHQDIQITVIKNNDKILIEMCRRKFKDPLFLIAYEDPLYND